MPFYPAAFLKTAFFPVLPCFLFSCFALLGLDGGDALNVSATRVSLSDTGLPSLSTTDSASRLRLGFQDADAAQSGILNVINIAQTETVDAFCARRRITKDLFRVLNPLIAGDELSVGDKLTVPGLPLSIVIDKSDFALSLLCGERAVMVWPIAHGKSGHRTPSGKYQITAMLVRPSWTHPRTGEYKAPGAADNPIGTRWIQFAPHLGIHGTNRPDSIGTRASLGCVRMRTEDNEFLFKLVSVGTPVIVRD
jgi:hypothetical protein